MRAIAGSIVIFAASILASTAAVVHVLSRQPELDSAGISLGFAAVTIAVIGLIFLFVDLWKSPPRT